MKAPVFGTKPQNHSRRRVVLLGALSMAAALGTVACDADFVDLRTDEEPIQAGGNDDGNSVADGGQTGSPVDAGFGAGSADAGFADGGATEEPAVEVVLRDGGWTGRSSYRASGTAELVRLPNGQREIRFSDDFDVSRVPGPVVLVSQGPNVGGRVDAAEGEFQLGALISRTGAQTYLVPDDLPEPLFVWVYCAPFAIEVARAALEVR